MSKLTSINSLHVTLLLPQTSLLLDSSRGRMAFILSTFVSTAATFPAAPSGSEWANQDKLEILGWCLPLEQDSKGAQQVHKDLV